MNQIQLAIARCVNAPIPKFDPEAQIKADAEARKRREERRIEQFIHKQWTEVPAAGLPHEVKPMLTERFNRLLAMLAIGADIDSNYEVAMKPDYKLAEQCNAAIRLIEQRGLDKLSPLRLQSVLAGYR